MECSPKLTNAVAAVLADFVLTVVRSVVFVPEIVNAPPTVPNARVSKPLIVYCTVPPFESKVNESVPAPPERVALAFASR